MHTHTHYGVDSFCPTDNILGINWATWTEVSVFKVYFKVEYFVSLFIKSYGSNFHCILTVGLSNSIDKTDIKLRKRVLYLERKVVLFFPLGPIQKTYFMLNNLINYFAQFILCSNILKEMTFREAYLICQPRWMSSGCTLFSSFIKDHLHQKSKPTVLQLNDVLWYKQVHDEVSYLINTLGSR